MNVDLVRTVTPDGITLDGVLHAATPDHDGRATMDAAICLSGVGSNFYGSKLIEVLAERLARDGVHALRVNTRGHDGVSTAKTLSGGQLVGAAYEKVDDCRLDITGWIDFLAERGYSRVGIIGHSLGALKALYSQAFESRSAVQSIIAISPPCLSYGRFRRGSQAAAFHASLATAQQHIADGQPDLLFRATFPFPLLISPATFIDKYGPGERYNFLHWVTQLKCPVAFLFGARELQSDNPAFYGIVERISELAWPQQAAEVTVIEGANHNYSGQLGPLADYIGHYVTIHQAER